MTSDPISKSEDGEIGIFDIADWLWAFRWLAAALLLCAAVWTAALFWTSRPTTPVAPTHDVTITIYPSGTPVRSAADISGTINSRLLGLEYPAYTPVGSNPVSVNVSNEEAVLAIVAQLSDLEEALRADVESQNDVLADLMRDENVSEFVSAQYVRNNSFLEGTQSGLIKVLDVSSRVIADTSRSSSNIRLLLPLIACGAIFIVVAGALTFLKNWQAHRRRKSSHS